MGAVPEETERRMLVQVCLNGARDVTEHPGLSADATLAAADAVGVTGITKLVFAPAARPAAIVQVTV